MDTEDTACIRDCPNPPPPSGCTVDNAFKAEDHCHILRDTSGAFADCLSKMDSAQREGLFENCVFDACNLDNYIDIVCRHAASLSRVCSDNYGMSITWRTEAFCPMECPENMEYKPCGDPCLPSCMDLEGENCGDLGPCQEGCFCQSGFVFDGEICISSDSCGCEVPDIGIFINVSNTDTTEFRYLTINFKC